MVHALCKFRLKVNALFTDRLARLINSRNCMDVKKSGAQQSGVYDVIIDGKITSVYCDMETDGGGWMVRKM